MDVTRARRAGRQGGLALLGALALLAALAQGAAANLIPEAQSRLTETGTPGDPAHAAGLPRVAVNPATGQGFAVFETRDNSVRRVAMQRLDKTGTPALDAPVSLFNPGAGRQCLTPDIAFATGQNRFVAAFVCDGNLSGQVAGEYDLVLVTIGLDGTPGTTRFERVGASGDANVIATNPRLSWSPQLGVFLVAYRQTAAAAPGDEIYGLTISPDLITVSPHGAISAVGAANSATGEAGAPAVGYVAEAQRWLVAWSGDPTVDDKQEVWAQRVGPPASSTNAPALIGAALRLAAPAPSGDAAYDAVEPTVVGVSPSESPRWFIAYAADTTAGGLTDDDFEIYTSVISSGGTNLGAIRVSTHGTDGGAPFSARSPDIAFDGARSEAAVVWRANDPSLAQGQTEIFGRRLSSGGTPLRDQRRLSDVRGGTISAAVTRDPVAARWRVLWSGLGAGPGAGADEEVMAARAGVEDVLGTTPTLTEVGDGDTFLEPGEIVEALQPVRNTGELPVTGLRSTAREGNDALEIRAGNVEYPNLAPGESQPSTSPFRVRLAPSLPCGRTAILSQDRVTSNGPIGLGTFGIPTGRPGGARDFAAPAPVDLPNGTIAQVPLALTAAGIVKDVDLLLDITHPDVSQLNVRLQTPSGAQFTLLSAGQARGANLTGTVFDDDSETPIASGTAPYTGTFSGPLLTNGVGTPAAGTWTLLVADTAGAGAGTINAFGLRIRTAHCAAPTVSIDPVGVAPVGAAVTLHGHAADADADARIVRYEWDLNNDGAFEVADGTADLTHTYTPAGTYTARLRVTDDSGETASANVPVTILPLPAPPPPPDRTAPGARIVPGALSRLPGALKAGLPFTWTCTEPSRLSVVGQIAGALARSAGLTRAPRPVKGRRPAKPKPFAIGYASVRCAKAGKVTGRLQLTPAARRRLGARARLSLALIATARDLAGNVSKPFRRPVALRRQAVRRARPR
jgi:subtilisin-like proprotein convertase family protein